MLYLKISQRGDLLTVGALVPFTDGVRTADAHQLIDLARASKAIDPAGIVTGHWAEVIGALRGHDAHSRDVIDQLIRYVPPPASWRAVPLINVTSQRPQ